MSNMYDILGKLKNVIGLDSKPVEAKEEPIYESVEPRGSITEAVRSLEEKYMGFEKTVAAVKKGGSAEDPEAVAAAIGRKKYGKKKFQKAAAAGKKLGEAAKPDYIDLDKDGDKTEPMKKAAKDAKKKAVKEGEYDPAPVDPEAVAKRKRLQALKDKQEDEHSYDTKKSNVRTVKGKAYGGAAQKDDAEKDDLDEVAPPGAKAERMVKHIKKGYAKDGKLTKREKGIAYATAWKAHNKGQVEEGVEFGDTIENSKAEMKKAKKVKVTESRMIQEGDYFYEKLGKALAEKDPTLNTADPSFVTAVRQEMVAQGIEPNRARNIITMDNDFISDVATSYGHYCKEIAECGGPMNSFVEEAPMLDVHEELDEIARLAGLNRSIEEAEVEEGNEFSGALAKAKAAGEKEFEVDGKTYTVKEETSVNDIRRLSGLAEAEIEEDEEELAEERDIEYVNTPREKVAPLSAAIPSGNDLHKSKMQDPETANKAANPLTRKAKQVEESLWKSYEDMINSVKQD